MLAQHSESSGPDSPLLTTRNGIPMVACRTNDASAADTSYSHEISEGVDDGNNVRQLWTPFFLRRSTMATFLVTFVAVLSTLIPLHYYYGRGGEKNGIGTEDWKYHYLWTYGPTAVFMLIGAFWTQVEYRACQLLPWLLMSQSPTAASDSVLLDYVSPWNVVSLFRSLKSGHYLVSLAVTGTLFIHGLAVVSTSLFELNAVPVQRRTPLQLTHTFDGSQFDPHAVDTRAFMTTWAMDLHNLSAPVGAVEDHVFPPFQEKGAGRDANFSLGRDREIEAVVDVLTVDVECEDATVRVNLTNELSPFSMEAPGCSFGPFSLTTSRKTGDNDTVRLEVEVAGCDGTESDASKTGFGGFKREDWRFWAFLSRKDPDGQQVEPDSSDRFSFTPVMCTPQYNMSRGPVRLSRPPDSGSISTAFDSKKQRPLPPLPDITAGHILYASRRSLYKSTVMENFQLLAPTRDDLEPFANSSMLSRQLERSMKSIGVQIAREYLLRSEMSEIEGNTASTENRLFVRQLSFGLMAGLLASLIFITISLFYFYLPLCVCCRDPSSIGGLATILAQSPEFRKSLSDMELKHSLEMRDLLVEQRYDIKRGSDGAFSINVKNGRYPQRQALSGSEGSPRWWRPLSTRFYMQIFTFGIPIALVITIEILLHLSNTKGGVAAVGGKSDGRHQPWAYIPALVMFGVRCLFQMTEFNTRIFQPFDCLSRGRAKASTSVLENQHRKIAVYGVLDSLRKRQWALAASSIALLLAAMLPIAVSGLYAIDGVTSSIDLTITQQSTWDLSGYQAWTSVGEQNRTDLVGGMIVYFDLPYPRWTHEELAFPQIALPDWPGASATTAGYVESRLPAWRTKLYCDELKQSDYSISWTYRHNRYYPEQSGRYIEVDVSGIREECGITLSLGQLVPEEGGYYAVAKSVESDDPIPPDCPTRVYMFGKSPQTNTTEAMKVLKCRPRIEEVDVDVRFEVPSFAIDPSWPPSVVPGSSRILVDGFFPGTSPLREVIPSLMAVPLLESDFGNEGNGTSYLRTEISAAIFGHNGVPADELLADAGKLEDALSRVFGIVAAQAFNSRARVPINATDASSPPPTFPASLVNEHERLVQSPVSSHILVGLQMAMLICGAISIVLINTKKVLPKNPCSIAALASLLVGSRMVESREIIPAGAEWWDDAELKRRGILVNRTFTMGWWLRKRERESTGGAEHGENEDEGALQEEKVFGIDVDEGDC